MLENIEKGGVMRVAWVGAVGIYFVKMIRHQKI